MYAFYTEFNLNEEDKIKVIDMLTKAITKHNYTIPNLNFCEDSDEKIEALLSSDLEIKEVAEALKKKFSYCLFNIPAEAGFEKTCIYTSKGDLEVNSDKPYCDVEIATGDFAKFKFTEEEKSRLETISEELEFDMWDYTCFPKLSKRKTFLEDKIDNYTESDGDLFYRYLAVEEELQNDWFVDLTETSQASEFQIVAGACG